MVIGISTAHIFMEKMRSYGKNNKNNFLETRAGIMPIGHSLDSYAVLSFSLEGDENPNIMCVQNIYTQK